MKLGAIVVEAGGRIADLETQLFQAEGIVPFQIRQQPAKGRFRALTSAAHLPQPDQTVIGFDFDDRANEAPPVCAGRMLQRRLQRHRHRGCTNVDDLHERLSPFGMRRIGWGWHPWADPRPLRSGPRAPLSIDNSFADSRPPDRAKRMRRTVARPVNSLLSQLDSKRFAGLPVDIRFAKPHDRCIYKYSSLHQHRPGREQQYAVRIRATTI